MVASKNNELEASGLKFSWFAFEDVFIGRRDIVDGTSWTVRDSNLSEERDFPQPRSYLYSRPRGSFPGGGGVKGTGM